MREGISMGGILRINCQEGSVYGELIYQLEVWKALLLRWSQMADSASVEECKGAWKPA